MNVNNGLMARMLLAPAHRHQYVHTKYTEQTLKLDCGRSPQVEALVRSY